MDNVQPITKWPLSGWLQVNGLRFAIFANTFLAVSPWLTLGLLYLYSWRGAALIGHWPRPSLDDPKYIGGNDLLYQWIGNLLWHDGLSVGLFLLIPHALVVFTFLTLALWGQRRLLSNVLCMVLYITGFYTLLQDPGNRLEWYRD